MQLKQTKTLIIAVVAIVAGYWFFSGSDDVKPEASVSETEVSDDVSEQETSQPVAAPQKQEQAATDAPAAAAPVKDAPAKIVARNFAPLETAIPSSSKMKAEVAANPHGPSASYLQFAGELGERMEAAQQSEERAKSFFPELDSCVRDPRQKGRYSVQALCLVNARRLAETYPSLQGEYKSLQQSAERETVALSNRIK